MDKVNELVYLAKRLEAVLDYTTLITVKKPKEKIAFSLDAGEFFRLFKGFKIEALEKRRFKFRLTKLVNGVEFSTLVHDLNDLQKIKYIRRNRLQHSYRMQKV